MLIPTGCPLAHLPGMPTRIVFALLPFPVEPVNKRLPRHFNIKTHRVECAG
jgi:hypothetical protein